MSKLSIQSELELQIVSSSILNDLANEYELVNENKVKSKILSEINNFDNSVKKEIMNNNPYSIDKLRLSKFREEFKRGNHTIEILNKEYHEFEKFMNKANKPIEIYWLNSMKLFQSKNVEKLELASANKSSKIKQLSSSKHNNSLSDFREYFHKKWQQKIDEVSLEWEMKQIAEFRKKFYEKLKTWLKLIEDIRKTTSGLDLDTGFLFDLSDAELKNTGIDELKKWVEYLSNNSVLKKICELIGRLRVSELIKKEKLVNDRNTFKINTPKISSSGEVSGIKLGNDIEKLIPEEKALLANDETANLFYLKFIEKRLLSYENIDNEVSEIEIDKNRLKKVPVEDNMGPMIVCVDTSGSMQGTPECVAKAITLFLANKAKQQNRKCYLINFSTRTYELDLSESSGIRNLIDFLKMSFYGGTDPTEALEKATKKLENEDYAKADVLTISDFVMGDMHEGIVNSIKDSQKNKNKFYSLIIAERNHNKNLDELFDKSWIYDPVYANFNELPRILNQITN